MACEIRVEQLNEWRVLAIPKWAAGSDPDFEKQNLHCLTPVSQQSLVKIHARVHPAFIKSSVQSCVIVETGANVLGMPADSDCRAERGQVVAPACRS